VRHEYSRHAPRNLLRLAHTVREADKKNLFGPLYTLISEKAEPTMKPVWKALTKREKHVQGNNEQSATDSAAMFLLEEVSSALNPPPPEKRRTRQRHAEDMMAISKSARELSRMVERSATLGESSVFELFSEDQLVWIAAAMDAEETIACAALDTKRSVVEAIRMRLLLGDPSISSVLHSLADLAGNLAKTPPLVRNVNIKNYEAVYFSRRMSWAMIRRYGQPLHATVAAVGSLFFGDVMTEEFVRKNSLTVSRGK